MTRRVRVVSPAVSADSAPEGFNLTAGIHAALNPTHQSEKGPSGRKGSSGDTPASQGKSGMWTGLEIEELKQLVSSNAGPTGNISWVKVSEAWEARNLPTRTKASLSSKWHDIKIKSAAVALGDPGLTQERTGESNPDPGLVLNVTSDTANNNSSSTQDENPTVAKEKENENDNDQCTPVD